MAILSRKQIHCSMNNLYISHRSLNSQHTFFEHSSANLSVVFELLPGFCFVEPSVLSSFVVTMMRKRGLIDNLWLLPYLQALTRAFYGKPGPFFFKCLKVNLGLGGRS